jgi:hypothetical protein
LTAFRKFLSAPGLFGLIHEEFKKIKLPEGSKRRSGIPLTDCLMSAVAMFSLKFPSLLKFDECSDEELIKHNLRTLYHVKQTPSDTYMRERCDEVEPREIRKVYKKLFAEVQRGKGLEGYEYLEGRYLLPGDGTGFFSSKRVRCDNCCIKHPVSWRVKWVRSAHGWANLRDKGNTYLLVKNREKPWEVYYVPPNKSQGIALPLSEISGLAELLGKKEKKELSKEEKEQAVEYLKNYHRQTHPDEEVQYYHHMFCAALVHPDKKMVLPFPPEPIMRTDGAHKNDCERNASRRLYADVRREHPHLRFIVVEDSLASNVPHLNDLTAMDMRYIVGVKPGDHKFLFDLVKQSPCSDYEHITENGTTHRYRYINQISLNKSHPDFKTNFIEYWETDKKGKTQHFCWVTDFIISPENAYDIMRGGRVNWRIENNTFNTLKNQDYHFSHNFGHGYQHLCTVFGMLMMLAFFVDQIQELCCLLFKQARAKFKSRTSLWEHMRGLFQHYLVLSWEDVFHAIIYGGKSTLIPNTS